METKKISSFDGTQLYTFYYPAKGTPKGGILWIHGAFEHADRYLEIIKWFAEQGYSSVAYDQRGHGRSGGTKMYIASIDDYLLDLKKVYESYQNELTNRVFLVGHSMGGLVTLRFWQKHPNIINNLQAVILSAPFLGVKVKLPAWKTMLSKLVVSILPKLSVPTDLDANLLSHDKKVVSDYQNDPKVSKKTTAGWFEEMLKQHQIAQTEAANTKGPLHILTGTHDGLVDTDAARAFYKKLPSSIDKSFNEFQGLFHEIFLETEPERKKVFEALYQLLEKY